jgi:hypothetical protein
MTEATDIGKRMSLHKEGQVTWPEPNLKRRCSQCALFTTDPKKTHRNSLPGGKGICLKSYNLDRNAKPKAFHGKEAIACPQYQA